MTQEKLIVKNFGPIKDAEIELGKVTVFIGEQASGKSVLAKLVAICKDINSIDSESYFENKILEYNIVSFLKKDTYLFFESDFCKINYSNDDFNFFTKDEYLATLDKTKQKVVNYNEKLTEIHQDLQKIIEKLDKSKRIESKPDENINNETPEKENNNFKAKVIETLDIINTSVRTGAKLLNDETQKVTRPLHQSIYVPTERLLISLISSTLISFINHNIFLPKYIMVFAELYNNAKLAKTLARRFSFFEYSIEDEVEYIKYKDSKIRLSETSTGFQSLVPLLLVLEEYSKINYRLFVVEEPELNLYPTTQKKLIEYLAGNIDKNSLILTTHSPYILSSLDNLIQAGNVVKKHPELKEEVEKIIPAQYHLNYEDVRVYFVADGKARLIMNEEYQSIDVSELDEVSEDLNADFEKLLDLKYQD